MAQLVGYLHNINISGHFWPKLGFLTPSDAHFLGLPQLLCNWYWRYRITI